MSTSLKFTLPRLRALSCPEGRNRVSFQDQVQPELLIQVTSSGSKSYYGRGWNPAKGYTEKKPIGKFEQVDLREARKRAREIATLLSLGKDPDAERKALRDDITFGEAFQSFIADPAKRKKKGSRREKTTEGYQWLYQRYIASRFRSKKLFAIHPSDVDSLHVDVGENNGNYAANRAVTLISAVFNDAICKGWQGQNPAQGIERYPEKSRDRFLEEHEIGPFIRACEVERESGSRTIAEAILLALFTGVRRTNVCSASWDHIDFDLGKWSIPDSRMKNREPHRVYLCDYAKEILARRYKHRTSDNWVFPGVGKSGHLVEPKKGIIRIVTRSEINPKGVHLHCMRHTFLTYADDICLPHGVRRRLGSHKENSTRNVTDIYTHGLERRVREAYEKVAEHMLEIAKQL